MITTAYVHVYIIRVCVCVYVGRGYMHVSVYFKESHEAELKIAFCWKSSNDE